MMCETQYAQEPFYDVDISFLDQKLILNVEEQRLKIDKGDIAQALDPECCQNEYVRHPVEIGGELFAVIGGICLDQADTYQRMHGYRLMPIMDFPGIIRDFHQIAKAWPHASSRCYTGLVLSMGHRGVYVMAEEVDIVPAEILV